VTSVLIVEDEESLADPLAFLLRKEGFEATVVADGPTALAEFERAGADIVLLDLMLPGMSGTEVCRQLRARSSVPVIMVTARDSEIDKVVGLELGADDYVTKPFSLRELAARARAVLRRRQQVSGAAATYRGTHLFADFDAVAVSVDGQPIRLTRREFELLRFLVENKGRVLSRDRLLERVWGYEHFIETRSVDVHVGRLRSKLGVVGSQIETVVGLGYRFVE
jgi:two-component system response regulator RegX3